jgi:capsule polysaccharide export protein KpsE/RkpR
MTRRRGRGRPYQPLPKRPNRIYAIAVVLIGLILVVGFGVLSSIR